MYCNAMTPCLRLPCHCSDDGSSATELGSLRSARSTAASASAAGSSGKLLLDSRLGPEEEELVEAVLQRPEAEFAANPFDVHTALLPASEAPAVLAGLVGAGRDGEQEGAGVGDVPVGLALALIDEQLAQYAMEHPWGQELAAQ
jgi:hypothetical protein